MAAAAATPTTQTDRKPRTLSLFSGIGGLDLGLERAGFRIVAQCEADPFCRAVLAKHWPGVPCFEDVRELAAQVTLKRDTLDPIECVCGGFPCQDVSVAGKGAGVEKGERSGLWREMLRIVDALRPRWVIAENVPALRTRGADRVLGDLEGLGYTCTPLVVGAEHVGAPHRRHRVFIVGDLADAKGQRALSIPERQSRPVEAKADSHGSGQGLEGVADAERAGRGARGGVQGDEGRAGQRRGESAGSGQLGHPQLPRLEGHGADAGGSQEPQPRDAGAPVGNAHVGARREQEQGRGPQGGTVAGRAGEAVEHADGDRLREQSRRGTGASWSEATFGAWPSPPGHPQNDWEAPRLVELPLGGLVDGVPARLVRAANRHALRAYGNAVVPHVAEVIGRAVLGGAA